MYYVYEIRNLKENKAYYGSTSQPYIRMKRHFSSLKNNKHHSFLLQEAFNKYHGVNNFKFKILYEFENIDDAKNKEEELINTDYENNYNISKKSRCGDIISYHPKLDEIRENFSNIMKERWKNLSEEEKLYYSERVLFNNNTNFKHGKYSRKTKETRLAELNKIKEENGLKNIKSATRFGKSSWNLGQRKENSERDKYLERVNKAKVIIGDNKIFCEGYIFNNLKHAEYIYDVDLSLRIISNKINCSDFRIATEEDVKKYPKFKLEFINNLKNKYGADYSKKPFIYKNIVFESVNFAKDLFNLTREGLDRRIRSNFKSCKDYRYATLDDLKTLEKYDPEKHKNLDFTFIKSSGRSRKVYCEGIIFNSMTEASRYCNMTDTSIRHRCLSEMYDEFYFIDE